MDPVTYHLEYIDLTTGNILVGDASGNAASKTMTGDVTINSSGVTNISSNAVGDNELTTLSSIDIDGGDIDGAAIGENSASTGKFTTLEASGNITVAGHNGTNIGLVLNSTLVTATAAEINVLDGLNASTSDLNVLNGISASTAELNTLTGFSGNTTELNYLDNVTPGTAAASKALTLDSSSNITGINDISLTGALTIDDTTQSTNTLTGSIQTDGGLGVAKDVFIGGNLVKGSTSPQSLIHFEGTTDGTGAGADGIVYIKQNKTWDGNNPWALYVDGYTNLGGFRINGDDGIRSLYKDTGQIGFATGDGSNITFTQNVSNVRLEIESNSGNVKVYQDLNTSGNTSIGTVNLRDGYILNINGAGYASGNLTTPSNLHITGHDGSSTGLYLGSTLVTATAAEMNLLSGFSGNTTELNYLDNVTPGTGAASKVVVLDSSQNIASINNLTLTGTIAVDDTTDSTSATTGSIQTDGGLGVAANVFIGGGKATLDGTNSRLDIQGTQAEIYLKPSTTGLASIEIGQGRAGDGNSYIDLIGDTSATDYGLRVIRNSGTNAVSSINQKGTGALRLITEDA